MARGKAPGCDGLPMEFYLKFWDVLGNDLVLVLNSAYRLGSLSCSQRRGIITLTFKKGDRLDPKNWRPITLLNADYKIASRSVAARLLKVIHLIVSRDQTCGVPGRFIGENVAFLRDIVDFCTFTGVPAALLSLDQEKAFDRVDCPFCVRLSLLWDLVSLLLVGLICFIKIPVVQLMLMVMFLVVFFYLGVCGRGVPCRPFFIF